MYTRYPIVARRAWPLGRVRRASKGILHTKVMYIRACIDNILTGNSIQFRTQQTACEYFNSFLVIVFLSELKLSYLQFVKNSFYHFDNRHSGMGLIFYINNGVYLFIEDVCQIWILRLKYIW